MRLKLLLCLLCLSLLISGCDLIPEISFPSRETPVPTSTQFYPEEIIPTATLPAYPPPEPQPTSTLPAYPLPEPQPTATLPTYPPPFEPTPDPLIDAAFTLQAGGPFYLPNFNHPEDGCQWQGVAGQVFDENGLEILNLLVIAGNRPAGEDHNRAATTGHAPAYGLGGYEIKLSSLPVNTSYHFWVQVVDSEGQPLSQRIYFDTLEDCEQNLILVNFVPLEAQNQP
jgi:hypothetical protein